MTDWLAPAKSFSDRALLQLPPPPANTWRYRFDCWWMQARARAGDSLALWGSRLADACGWIMSLLAIYLAASLLWAAWGMVS